MHGKWLSLCLVKDTNKQFLKILIWIIIIKVPYPENSLFLTSKCTNTRFLLRPLSHPPLIPPLSVQFSSVQLLSHVRLFVTPWTAACQASLSITNSRSSLKLMSIIHRVGDAIQPSHPLPSPSPPAPNPSQHQSLFQWVNTSHEVAKLLEFQLQHHSFQRTPRTDLL